MAYDQKAQDFAYTFYSRGVSRDRAVREIRKVYAGFSGSTWDEWEKKLAWRERRAQADVKLREFEELAQNTASVLLLELDEIRKKLLRDIGERGADVQTVYAYTSVAKQISEISRQHLANRDGGRVALEVLNLAFQHFLTELREIPDLAKPLEANAAKVGKLIEKTAQEFGLE
jgi:uroporphyrinogen-III synthase